jgi:hypothetical protein
MNIEQLARVEQTGERESIVWCDDVLCGVHLFLVEAEKQRDRLNAAAEKWRDEAVRAEMKRCLRIVLDWPKAKPSISELEDLLKMEAKTKVEVLPDGTVNMDRREMCHMIAAAIRAGEGGK